MQKLYTAIATFRQKVSAVKKDADNPFFKSKYADLPSILEVIKQPLQDSGLAITHHCKATELGFSMITILGETESGESIQSEFPIFGSKPQEVGSSMSYARRYNLLALLDIPTEDDDGNTANEAPRTKYTGAEQKKYFNKKDLEECIKEGFDNEQGIASWIKDYGFTVGGPMKTVIRHYLEKGEIIDPVYN